MTTLTMGYMGYVLRTPQETRIWRKGHSPSRGEGRRESYHRRPSRPRQGFKRIKSGYAATDKSHWRQSEFT